MRTVQSLAVREWLRFYRQRSRVIGALLTPLLFWLFFGFGLSPSFHPSSLTLDINYLQYLIPGNIALVLLFSSIFSTISVIDDRNMGFLQGVLVAPVPRYQIVLGKILGGSSIAFVQGAVLLLLVHLLLGQFSLLAFLSSFITLALMSFALTSLGFFFAWKFNSVQGFHSIMNTLLFPMWFLSGALFPISESYSVLKVICLLNPLSYGVSILQNNLNHVAFPFMADSFLLAGNLYLLIFGLLFLMLSSIKVRDSYAFN